MVGDGLDGAVAIPADILADVVAVSTGNFWPRQGAALVRAGADGWAVSIGTADSRGSAWGGSNLA